MTEPPSQEHRLPPPAAAGGAVNLVRAEFLRLVTRRFTQLMVALLVAAFAITVATTLATSHRPADAELRQAEVQADRQRVDVTELREQCEEAHLPNAPPDLALRFDQVDCGVYDPDDVEAEDFLAGVFSFSGTIRNLLFVLSALLALFGFLVGASFVGAELTSGGMTNLLLWRPQRLLVLGVKLASVLTSVAALAMVTTIVYLGTFWALAEMVGTTGHTGDGFWSELVAVSVRGIGLALVAAAAGFAIATIGRHTSAAVGLVAGYAVVWELGARLMMTIAETDQPSRWMLTSYLGAWMIGHVDFWEGGEPSPYTIHWWQAGVVFAALLGALVGTAFAQFRRRDLA